ARGPVPRHRRLRPPRRRGGRRRGHGAHARGDDRVRHPHRGRPRRPRGPRPPGDHRGALMPDAYAAPVMSSPSTADPAVPLLEVSEVTKVFRRGRRTTTALDGISLRAGEGEFITVVGPSGCGKSTLLHIIGGFETPSSGSVTVAGTPVTRPGRDRGMVF